MFDKHFHITQICILPFSNIERGVVTLKHYGYHFHFFAYFQTQYLSMLVELLVSNLFLCPGLNAVTNFTSFRKFRSFRSFRNFRNFVTLDRASLQPWIIRLPERTVAIINIITAYKYHEYTWFVLSSIA